MTEAKSTPKTLANSLSIKDQPRDFGDPLRGTYAFFVVISAASIISTYMTVLSIKYRSTLSTCIGYLLLNQAVKVDAE